MSIRLGLRPWFVLGAAIGLLGLVATPALAAKFNRKVDIGRPAPAWKDLMGADGRKHSLGDYKKARVLLILVFTCNQCPVSQLYEDRLIDFVKRYRPLDVRLVAISCSLLPPDRLEKMKERAEQKHFNFDYVWDPMQQTGKTTRDRDAAGVRSRPEPEYRLHGPLRRQHGTRHGEAKKFAENAVGPCCPASSLSRAKRGPPAVALSMANRSSSKEAGNNDRVGSCGPSTGHTGACSDGNRPRMAMFLYGLFQRERPPSAAGPPTVANDRTVVPAPKPVVPPPTASSFPKAADETKPVAASRSNDVTVKLVDADEFRKSSRPRREKWCWSTSGRTFIAVRAATNFRRRWPWAASTRPRV